MALFMDVHNIEGGVSAAARAPGCRPGGERGMMS
jgi:hypothetical protein